MDRCSVTTIISNLPVNILFLIMFVRFCDKTNKIRAVLYRNEVKFTIYFTMQL